MKQRAVTELPRYRPESVPYYKSKADKGRSTGWSGRLSALLSRQDSHAPLRNFSWATAGGVVYFSAGKTELQRFGFQHGDRLTYGEIHPMRGSMTTVIGVRGGRLYVDDDEGNPKHNASPLRGSNYDEIQAHYGFTVGERADTLDAMPLDVKWGEAATAFLQNAPDLVVKVGETPAAIHLTPFATERDGGLIGWTGEGTTDVLGGGVRGVPADVVSAFIITPDEDEVRSS